MHNDRALKRIAGRLVLHSHTSVLRQLCSHGKLTVQVLLRLEGERISDARDPAGNP